MIETVQLGGTDKQLYQLVAPLVMNPEVLKQNYNFPFRTKESFVWFIALENEEVLGFIPVENRKYNAATMLHINSILCVPRARLCRMVEAILFDKSFSITTTGSKPFSRSYILLEVFKTR